jgi:hypothetical protein
VPLVARNPVIRNSEAKISVYASSVPICWIGNTFVMRPSFSFGGMWSVRAITRVG